MLIIKPQGAKLSFCKTQLHARSFVQETEKIGAVRDALWAHLESRPDSSRGGEVPGGTTSSTEESGNDDCVQPITWSLVPGDFEH